MLAVTHSKRPNLIAAVAIRLGLCTTAHAESDTKTIHIVSAEIPGYVEPDGSGSYQIALGKAAKQSGFEIDYRLMPWIRAVSMAQTSDRYVIIPFSRTAERELNYQWLEVLNEIENGFVTTDRKIDTLEDAESLDQIVVWRATAQEGYLKNHGFENLFPVSTADMIFGLLENGRASAWFGVLEEAQDTISQGQMKTDLIFGDPIYVEQVWLAAGPKFDATAIKPFLDAVSDLRSRGELFD